MIRALERAQGAALAREPAFEEARSDEAARHARRFGEELRIFTSVVGEVTNSVRGLPVLPEQLPSGGRLMTLLSDGALAELYQMGVPRSDLNIPVMERVNDDPRELFNSELEALAEACMQYSTLLIDSSSQAFDEDNVA